MPTHSAPTSAEVAALAERALRGLGGEGQAEARWERRLDADGVHEELVVTVTAVHDGRAGRATTTDVDDVHLARTARTAALRARQPRAWPAGPLPEPAPGRAHAGFDHRLLGCRPATAIAHARAAAGEDLEVEWRAGLCRTATVSTRGVRATEQRSHVVCRVRGDLAGGRTAQVTVCGTGQADVVGAATDVRALLGEGRPARPLGVAIAPGPAQTIAPTEPAGAIVLGPEAVAAVLDHLRGAFGVHLALGSGPLHGRRGTRVAAEAVHLDDVAGDERALPRSYDAEGLPRRAVTLIRDGIAVGQVHDSASAARAGDEGASTGHATRAATLAPYPDHLVLARGEARDLVALCAPVARGVFIPALSERFEATPDGHRHQTVGGALIGDGRVTSPLAPFAVVVNALEVLAAVEALTAERRLLPLRGHTPGGVGAATVPALRTGGGVRVAP